MRILLIVPPERFDFYDYLAKAEGVEWILLWHEKPSQMLLKPSDLPMSFRRIHYWTEFSTPFDLFKKIGPERIVFFEIIDLRQIALIVSARAKQIPTFYLEHGAAGDMATAKARWDEITFFRHKGPYLINRLKNSFVEILLSKYFYYSVFTGFYSLKSYFTYFLLPFKMLGGAPNEVLSRNKFRERIPAKAILFNDANFEEFVTYTGIKRNDALFPGVPFFDKFCLEEFILGDHIVYIDHPYLEESINNWTEAHHHKVANTLFEFAEKNMVRLYVKLHPRSDLSLWDKYDYNRELITIIQFGDYTKLYLEAKLLIGFSSSLITGFLCARKNVVLLGWHPVPGIFGADFSKTGLCHVSYSPNDLNDCFESWVSNNLTWENDIAYEAYLKRFNYPFDGQASERVIRGIIFQ